MRRIFVVIAAVLGLAAVAFLFTLSGRHVKPGLNVGSIEADIKQHLPIGSTRAEVTAFLEQRGINHSYVSTLKELPNYEYVHTETAMIPNASKKGLFKSGIQIKFRFDDSDRKMISYSVKELVTGP